MDGVWEQQGEDITKRGEFGGDLYIVQSGHVELKDYHGHRSYIHDKGCFNELELLHEFLIGSAASRFPVED